MREETALGGHISAVMWLDDLEVKARHADDLDVVSSKRLLDISLSSDLSTETFVEFYGCFKILCEKRDMRMSCDVFHDKNPFRVPAQQNLQIKAPDQKQMVFT